MRKIGGTVLIFSILLFIHPVHAQFGKDLSSIFYNDLKPVEGGWSEYKIISKAKKDEHAWINKEVSPYGLARVQSRDIEMVLDAYRTDAKILITTKPRKFQMPPIIKGSSKEWLLNKNNDDKGDEGDEDDDDEENKDDEEDKGDNED